MGEVMLGSVRVSVGLSRLPHTCDYYYASPRDLKACQVTKVHRLEAICASSHHELHCFTQHSVPDTMNLNASHSTVLNSLVMYFM